MILLYENIISFVTAFCCTFGFFAFFYVLYAYLSGEGGEEGILEKRGRRRGRNKMRRAEREEKELQSKGEKKRTETFVRVGAETPEEKKTEEPSPPLTVIRSPLQLGLSKK